MQKDELFPCLSPHQQLRNEPLSFRRFQLDQSICRSQALEKNIYSTKAEKKKKVGLHKSIRASTPFRNKKHLLHGHKTDIKTLSLN